MQTTFYSPKTATEAARVALLSERANEIIREGYAFSYDPDINVTYVCKPGQLSSAYEIADGKCNCPARQKDPTCKHEIAAQLKAEEEARDAAQCKEWEEAQANSEGTDSTNGAGTLW